MRGIEIQRNIDHTYQLYRIIAGHDEQVLIFLVGFRIMMYSADSFKIIMCRVVH